MNENSSVIVVLCSHLCAQNCKPLEPSEWTVIADRLIAENKQPRDIIDFTDDDFKCYLGYDENDIERIKRLLDRSGSIVFELQKYSSMGINVVTRADVEYPKILKKQLKGNCPPMFYYAGDIALALRKYIGFVGSRTVSEDDSVFAASTVTKVNALGYGVVSGGAKGVDSIASETSLNNGNICIEYISDSFVRKIKKHEVVSAVQDGKLLILSVAKPDVGFNAGFAMMRNKYIYAHSAGTVVVKSDYKKGGTWSGATDALKKELCPVLCRNQRQYPGNAELIRMGAIPIDDTWNGDITKLDNPSIDQGTQLSLFD